MIIHRNIISEQAIESILSKFRTPKTNTLIRNKHSSYIDKLINYQDIYYCDTKDTDLLYILSSIVEKEDFSSIYSIHYIRYTKGYECLEHTDMSSIKTYICILNDKHVGGDLYVNGINTNAKKGDVVTFNGTIEHHKVTQIVEGTREVLVIWINPLVKKESIL